MRIGEAFTRRSALLIADLLRGDGVSVDVKYSCPTKKWIVYKYDRYDRVSKKLHKTWKNQMREELG